MRDYLGWGALAVVLGSVSAASPALAQEPDSVPIEIERADPDAPEVEVVRFEGAESLDPLLLEDVIFTRATRCRSPIYSLFCLFDVDWAVERFYLDEDQLARDQERLRELYVAWGFPDAQVRAEIEPRNGDRVGVTFEIEEGEPIIVESIEVAGLDRLDPPVELESPLPLEPGDTYALPLLEETRLLVVAAFAERGRPYSEIVIEGDVDEVARTVRLVLEVDPGPTVVFGEPTVEAEAPIDDEVVLERLAFEPGDLFRPSALVETERLLYALPIVESVSIEPVGLEEGELVVSPRITVEAGRTQAVQLQGTVSSTYCLQAVGSWAHRYFLGGPRVFSLSAGASNLFADQLGGGFPCTSTGEGAYANPNYFVRAELRQPWPGSPRTEILANAFVSRESAPFVYVQRGYGGQLGVLRQIRLDLIGSFRYSPQRYALSAADVYFCGNYGACDPGELDDLTGYHWLSPLQAQLFWTPTGPPQLVRRALPGERWRRWVNGAVDGAAPFTGSSYDYLRGIGEVGVTRLFGTRYELASRGRLGLVADFGNVIPPQVRLYSGGVNTVRGVQQNLLGPKFLLVSPERALELGCELEPGGCPPGVTVGHDQVGVRPAGGEAVVELNLEGRVWLTRSVQGAAFADYGMLRRRLGGRGGGLFDSDAWETLITPGIGLRILSPIGPVRLDLAYDPSGVRQYPLLTRDPETDDLIFLGPARYAPFTFDDPDGLREFWRRLQFHLAIGQPF